MRINSKKYKVAVFSLIREGELDVAKVSMSGIFSQLDESTQAFLLLNGPNNAEIEEYFSQIPFVTVACEGENLGVAGGRNKLVELALIWGADILVSYDNDLIPQENYLKEICTHLVNISKNLRVGIIAPAVVNAHECNEFWEPLYLKCKKALDKGAINDGEFIFSAEELRRFVCKGTNGISSRMFYHLGIKNWEHHYFGDIFSEVKFLFYRLIQKTRFAGYFPDSYQTFLAENSQVQRAVLEGDRPIEVDTLPGGVHCFFSSTIKDIGGYDNIFNPFGFEDADLCIRSFQSGRKNFLIPSLLLIHDIDNRLNNRDFALKMRLKGKQRRIFIEKFINRIDRKIYLILRSILLDPILILRNGIFLTIRKEIKVRDVFRAIGMYLFSFFRY